MYVIKNKKNENYYGKRISSDIIHYVRRIEEAHKFKNKYQAEKVLNKYIYKENFELIKYRR